MIRVTKGSFWFLNEQEARFGKPIMEELEPYFSYNCTILRIMK